jgi:hypothetical protein
MSKRYIGNKILSSLSNAYYARIQYDTEYQEYAVKFYRFGGYWLGEETTYYTNDKTDAINTASISLDSMVQAPNVYGDWMLDFPALSA